MPDLLWIQRRVLHRFQCRSGGSWLAAPSPFREDTLCIGCSAFRSLLCMMDGSASAIVQTEVWDFNDCLQPGCQHWCTAAYTVPPCT